MDRRAAGVLARGVRAVLAPGQRRARLPARRLRALPARVPPAAAQRRPARSQPSRGAARARDRRIDRRQHHRGLMKAVARAAGTAAAVLVLDQVSKALVRAHVDRGSEDGIFPGVKLVHTRNSGVAFGLFDNGGALIAIFTIVALGALLT